MTLKFSIVTPSYNQGEFIEATIQSVLSQEVDLEYWVIDGGSTDQTLEILKKYKKAYKNFHYISEPDQGQSDAINKGIKRSNGDIIAYLNSDDLYLPQTLQTVEKIASDHLEFKWFYGRSIIINSQGEKIQSFFSKIKNWLGEKYSYKKLLMFNIISQPSTFLRSELFDRYGFFKTHESLVIDYEYWVRIGKENSGFPIHQNLAQFRYHHESKSQNSSFTLYFRELKVAYHYSHKLFDLPLIFVHLIHFLMTSLWTKFTIKNT